MEAFASTRTEALPADRRASEVDYLALLAADLGYFSSSSYAELATELTEIRRMLTGFHKQIRLTVAKNDEKLRANS